MRQIEIGLLRARLAAGPDDLLRVADLRQQVFRSRRGLTGPDSDRFDARSQHMMIEDTASNALLCCYRLITLPDGRAIHTSYAAQFYDLTRLSAYPAAMLELGRFCLAPGLSDPDVLRLAWGALAQRVDAVGAGMLFGCSSFDGAAPEQHRAALAVLQANHLGPDLWRPDPRPGAIALPQDRAQIPDLRAGIAAMPPLLRSYLALGGWVSDHAVQDHDLDTLHVFTAVETATIPPARARALRAIAG